MPARTSAALDLSYWESTNAVGGEDAAAVVASSFVTDENSAEVDTGEFAAKG